MSDLSESAKVIMRHFRDKEIPQLAYEYPSILEGLFNEPEECERAQAELYSLGLIDLGPELPRHIPANSRVRAAALTLEGERYIASHNID